MNIIGKALIFTDIHFGLKKDSEKRLDICVKVIDSLIDYAKTHTDVKNVIFCGDLFHQRTSIDVNTMSVAHRCISRLAEQCNVYLILGNHDIFNSNSVDVNSSEIFKPIKNVHVISCATEVSINGLKALFCPWLSSPNLFEKESYDLLFGHFDSNMKLFDDGASFIADNSDDNDTDISDEIEHELSDDSFLVSEIKNNAEKKSSDCGIGDFIDLLRIGGSLFSGHIHQHKEYMTKGRHFIYVGSPYQQTYNEADSEDGFYVLNENGSYEFKPLDNLPKFNKIFVSTIMKRGIDNFNFNKTSGNIITVIYDVEVDSAVEYEITKRIHEASPYEELTPEYNNSVIDNDDVVKESMESLRKSKLDYLLTYINGFSEDKLAELGLDRNILIQKTMDEYNKIMNGGKI